jgi:hypothetical protein
LKKLFFQHGTQGMLDRFVPLLDIGNFLAGHNDRAVAQGRQAAAGRVFYGNKMAIFGQGQPVVLGYNLGDTVFGDQVQGGLDTIGMYLLLIVLLREHPDYSLPVHRPNPTKCIVFI